MNPIEDQVRAATRAEASALREVRPLRLPPTPGAPPRGPPLAAAPLAGMAGAGHRRGVQLATIGAPAGTAC